LSHHTTETATSQTNEAMTDEAMCRACGACCAFSAEWPRFSLETEDELGLIPRRFVDDERGRMRCHGDRCTALVGELGVSTSCAAYAVRPHVCRTCMPGDDACLMARRRFNMTALQSELK
jgi:Fe-S-cluster containining protein